MGTSVGRSRHSQHAVHTEQTVNMEQNGKEAKSISQLFVEDFEVQNWKLHGKTKNEVMPKSRKLFGLYCFDYVFCHLIIGTLY